MLLLTFVGKFTSFVDPTEDVDDVAVDADPSADESE
jgi:hypothetical protein